MRKLDTEHRQHGGIGPYMLQLYAEGKSCAEIAAQVGMSERMVSYYLAKDGSYRDRGAKDANS